MKLIHILVEGQTEQAFVIQVLQPHLLRLGIHANPVILYTKRTSTKKYKGGIQSYQKVRKQILELLGDTYAAVVTTMIDLYGLPEHFPNAKKMFDMKGVEKALALENAFTKDIEHSKFKPYLQVHEFETLLFSYPKVFKQFFDSEKYGSGIKNLDRIAQQMQPEEIDEGKETAPSKRIITAFPEYKDQKAILGPLLAEAIGLKVIRERCPHFNAWLSFLERLAI